MASSDFAWLAEHDQELCDKYPGKWIAVWQKRVIAVGEELEKVANEADCFAPPGEYILRALDPGVDVIYGSLLLV